MRRRAFSEVERDRSPGDVPVLNEEGSGPYAFLEASPRSESPVALVRAWTWLCARHERAIVGLLALGLVLFVTGLGQRSLWTPDEGRYAEIPHEMLASGDWLTPRLNGVKYFEKPPLHYWLVGAAFRLLGETELAARLPCALCATVALLIVYGFGAACFGAEVGLLAALMLAVSPLYFALARMDIIDTPLMLFYTLGMAAWGVALLGPEGRRQKAEGSPDGDSALPRALNSTPPSAAFCLLPSAFCLLPLAGWAGLALATLVKGPVALALPAGTVFLWMLLTRQWGRWRALMPLPGLALYLAIAAPWFVAVSRRNPEFAWFFFIHEHVLRFLTTEHHHEGPIWYYLPVLLLGFFPWSAWLPAAAFAALKAKGKRQKAKGKSESPTEPNATSQIVAQRHRPFAFCLLPFAFCPPSEARQLWLLLWAAVPFVFFSLSGSKLITYVLPAFPALALLVAAWWTEAAEGDRSAALRRGALGMAAGAAVLAILLPLALPIFGRDPAPGAEPWLILCAAVLLAGAITVLLAARGSRGEDQLSGCAPRTAHRAPREARMLAVLVVMAVIFGMTLDRVELALDAARGMRQFAAPIFARPDARLVYLGDYDQALNFYSRRGTREVGRGVILGYEGELAFGREHAPDAAYYFRDERALPALLAEPQATFYFVKSSDWPRLKATFAGRAQVVVSDRRHVLLLAPGGSHVASAR